MKEEGVKDDRKLIAINLTLLFEISLIVDPLTLMN
jgi:hypothetical protein